MGIDQKVFVQDIRAAADQAAVAKKSYKYLFKKVKHDEPEASNFERINNKMSDLEKDLPEDKRAAVQGAVTNLISNMPLAAAFKDEAVKACRRSVFRHRSEF